MAAMVRSLRPMKSGSLAASGEFILASRDVAGNGVGDKLPGQRDALARDLVGRSLPLLRVGRLVAEIAGVALLREEAEHVVPFDDALAGRQPIGRPPHAGNRIGRKVAVLETENLLPRHVRESSAGRAAAGEMIGIDQVTAVRPGGAPEQLV